MEINLEVQLVCDHLTEFFFAFNLIAGDRYCSSSLEACAYANSSSGQHIASNYWTIDLYPNLNQFIN